MFVCVMMLMKKRIVVNRNEQLKNCEKKTIISSNVFLFCFLHSLHYLMMVSSKSKQVKMNEFTMRKCKRMFCPPWKNVSIFELSKKKKTLSKRQWEKQRFFLIQKKKINDFFAEHKKLNKKEKVSRNQTKSK